MDNEEVKTFEDSLAEVYAECQQDILDGSHEEGETKKFDMVTKNMLTLRQQDNEYYLRQQELEIKRLETEAKIAADAKKDKHEIIQNWTKVGVGAAVCGFEGFLAYSTLKFNLKLGTMVGDKNKGTVLKRLQSLGSIFK